MKLRALSIAALLLINASLHAEIGFKPFGFVAADLFYDSRQVFGARDNFALLWPLRVLPDIYGNDINAHPQGNLTAIQTRIGITAEQPWFKDWKISGTIEGDFLGIIESTTGDYRIRHAFVLLEIPTWSILAGQWWHPLWVIDCFPDTISYNNGSPMEPQAREPQLRFDYKAEHAEIILAALGQGDFGSIGPEGSSNVYIRNACVPNFHAQLKYYFTPEYLVGGALDYLRLVPEIVTEANVATNNAVNSIIAEVFAAINKKKYQIRTKVVYGQNANDQLMISGFAVETQDPVTQIQTYTPTAAIAAWIDMAYWFGKDLTQSVGLFIGGTKNLGAGKPLYIDPETNQPIVYTYDPTLGYVWRVEPRYRYKTKAYQIGLELEITSAGFGELNRCAAVPHTTAATNVRVLFEILYFF